MLDFVVYPGTFDPVTYGHIDVVERSLRLYHRVLIAVAESQSKQPLFTTEERIRLIHQAVGHLSGVSIERFDGLLVDYLRHKGASAVIRGLRATSDFEYELQMALANRQLSEKFETIFLMPSQEYIFLSSRIVKGVASLGGDVSSWVPPGVYEALMEKYRVFPGAAAGER